MYTDNLFNGAVEGRALRLVACSDEAEVRIAVLAAGKEGRSVAVLAGGHDMWGRGFVEGNVVIDVRAMKRITIGEGGDTVTIGGAVLAGELLAALPRNRAAVTGTILSVGMAGLTLGGGYGALNGRFGLACDNLLGARMVLASGDVVQVDADENADMLWALRGGGGGFGVVTELTLALHALPQVLTAMVFVELDHAMSAMLLAQRLIDGYPEDLGLFMGFMTGPAGAPVLFLAPTWSGHAHLGEVLVRRLADLQGAQLAGMRWSFYSESFDPASEAAFPKGAHYLLLTRTLRRLDEEAAAILIEGARKLGPTDAIILHDSHGAASRPAPEATAFALRDDHFVVEVIAASPAGGAQMDERREWARSLDCELRGVALPGGYTGLLAPDEHRRVAEFFGSNVARLAEIKRGVDPGDLFRSAVGRLA